MPHLILTYSDFIYNIKYKHQEKLRTVGRSGLQWCYMGDKSRLEVITLNSERWSKVFHMSGKCSLSYRLWQQKRSDQTVGASMYPKPKTYQEDSRLNISVLQHLREQSGPLDVWHVTLPNPNPDSLLLNCHSSSYKDKQELLLHHQGMQLIRGTSSSAGTWTTPLGLNKSLGE